jgi:hypothetical protein
MFANSLTSVNENMLSLVVRERLNVPEQPASPLTEFFSMPDTNFHVAYPDVYRYWSPNCEKYAGGDALLTKLRDGWKADQTCYAEEHWLAGMRLVVVFHIELTRGSEKMIMPVISNPFVRRMIVQESFKVKPISEKRLTARLQHDTDVAASR